MGGEGGRGPKRRGSLSSPGPIAMRGGDVVGDEHGRLGRSNSGEGDDRGKWGWAGLVRGLVGPGGWVG